MAGSRTRAGWSASVGSSTVAVLFSLVILAEVVMTWPYVGGPILGAIVIDAIA